MMDRLRLLTRRHELVDATVIAFQCDGCMATDHKLRWIGQVTEFRNQREVFGSDAQPLTLAMIKVLKRDDHRDSRDHDLGIEHAVVEDLALQKVGPKLWFYYR